MWSDLLEIANLVIFIEEIFHWRKLEKTSTEKIFIFSAVQITYSKI